MVNIHLKREQNDEYMLALSIPLEDIQRLSVRPLKWLRFVTFAVCGVTGELSPTQNGPVIEYQNIGFDSLADDYYYKPDGDYKFVDYKTLNDRTTSTHQTPRTQDFRQAVIDRDGLCVFTREDETDCDAAHIIPRARSKGSDYIEEVVRDRCNSYNPVPELDLVTGIDSVENGILLAKDLHSLFGGGKMALLKTPNFALDCADVPRVEQGLMPTERITMQYLVPPRRLYMVPAVDAIMTGTGNSPPPSVILDFTYGAAAYKRWQGGPAIAQVMEKRHEKYLDVLRRPTVPDPSYDNGEEDVASDPQDEDYRPPGSKHRKERYRSTMSEGMLRAMDDVLALSMWMKGHTRESLAAERQKRAEQAEARAQEAGRLKAQQWVNASFLTKH